MIVIEDYQRLSDITGQMRDAAIAGEWDSMITLEKCCAQKVADIKPHDLVPSDEATRLQKIALINKILADDKAIRECTEPWMRQLQQIIQSGRIEQRLQQSYLAEG